MTTSRQVLAGVATGAVLGATALMLQSSEQSDLAESVKKQELALKSAPSAKRTLREAAAAARAADAPAGGEEAEADPALAKLTPDEVIQMLKDLEEAEDPVRASLKMLSAMQHLPADRIPEAMAVIKAWKRPFINMGVVPVLYARWGELDPKAAMESAMKNDMEAPVIPIFGGEAGKANMVLKLGVFAGWVSKDPAEAMKWMKEENPFGKRGGRDDSEEAAGVMAMFLAGDKSRSQAIADTISPEKRLAIMAKAGLVDTDTPEAMDKAMAQATSPEARQALLREGIGKMVENDPLAAMTYLQGQPEADRAGAMGNAFRKWASDDPMKAIDWYSQQPEEQRKGIRPQDLGWQLSDRSADDVRAYAGKLPEADRDEFMTNSVQVRSWQNPAESAALLPEIKDQAKQAEMARNTAERWGQQDQEKAAAWVGTQPPGPVRDSAVQGFAESAWDTHKDGEGAALWIETMSDESQRTTALTNHGIQWMQKEPEAAGEWLQNSQTLTEEQKAAIIAGAQAKAGSPPAPPIN